MGGKSSWSLRDIYLYLVCLITLIIALFGLVNLLAVMAEMIFRYQSGLMVSEIRHAATLIAAGSVYVYHWRKIEKHKGTTP